MFYVSYVFKLGNILNELIVKQLMNSAFVGYEELSRSRRVLSTSADNTLLNLLNSSYPTQPHSLTANYLLFTIPAILARAEGQIGSSNVTWFLRGQTETQTAICQGKKSRSRLFILDNRK